VKPVAIDTLHKKRPRKAKNPVVETSSTHDFVFDTRAGSRDRYSVTYQRELVRCGKPKCRKWHGPYWYAYWTVGTRTRTLYIGKVLRPACDVLAERERKPKV
jgi:hypothetical protein